MKINTIKYLNYFILITLICIPLMSCEDFVDIEAPKTEVTPEKLFSTDQTAVFALNGVYEIIANSFTGMYSGFLEIFTGLASDELDNYFAETTYQQFHNNDILPDNSRIATDFWAQSYRAIQNANGVVEGVRNNDQLTPEIRDQILGEALFIRAFCHFYLVNLFGPVPYSNTTSVEANNTASRESVEQVYEKIITDLVEAQSLMVEDFETINDGVVERGRVNKLAATALLSRAYLYVENWAQSEEEATKVINNNQIILEADLNDVFLDSSQEVIWRLITNEFSSQPATELGKNLKIYFNRLGGIGEKGATLISNVALTAFEPGDLRRSNWLTVSGSYEHLNKYKNNFLFFGEPEYIVTLRLAELYLIRAEARARQNNLAGAQEDINVIRNRAGLENTTATTQQQMLDAIAQERRIELLVEGGHRWLDLKRTGQADQVLAPLKSQWQPTDVLWPIPEIEIFNNSNLLPQNEGY